MIPTQLPDPADTLEISAQDLAQLLQERDQPGPATNDAPTPFILVDCRETEEHEYCRLGGDVLIPLSQFAELAPQRLTDREIPIVVYCHHGIRSAQAASFLRSKGHAHTFSLAGGIEHWSLTIDPDVPRY